LNTSSSLNRDLEGWIDSRNESTLGDDWTKVSVKIHPKDFFLFGSGNKTDEADFNPKEELKIAWDKDGTNPSATAYYLIPGSSVKGALAHRLAFHYNRLQGRSVQALAREHRYALPNLDMEALESALSYYTPSDKTPSGSPLWQQAKAVLDDVFSLEQALETKAWKQFEDALDEAREKAYSLPVGEMNEAVKSLFGFAKKND
jgi:hypothetical protein